MISIMGTEVVRSVIQGCRPRKFLGPRLVVCEAGLGFMRAFVCNSQDATKPRKVGTFPRKTSIGTRFLDVTVEFDFQNQLAFNIVYERRPPPPKGPSIRRSETHGRSHMQDCLHPLHGEYSSLLDFGASC